MKKRERPKFKRAANRSSPQVSAAMKALGKLARKRLLLSNEPPDQDEEAHEPHTSGARRKVMSQGLKLTRAKPKAAVPALADVPVDLDIRGTAPAKLSVVGENGNV